MYNLRICRHTIKPGTPEHETTEQGTPPEHRNSEHPQNGVTPPEHRNTHGTTEHCRNNGTPPEQSKHRGTVEHYDRALAE